MLDNIIKFSIKNKLIVGVFIIGLIGLGIYSLKRLPIDAVPDITNNQVQIITSAPSQSAQDIERLVTFPIEITMSSIPDIEEIRSFSRFGLSVVTVVFKDQVDIYWARQQINERLIEAKNQIPEGIGVPEMAPVTTGLGEIYQYTLYAKKGFEEKYTAMELRTIQDWIVRRQLLGIEGVADVSSFGGFLKQYEVALLPERMQTLGVSINEVFAALEKNNQNTGGAYIDKNPKAYFIRSEGLIKNAADIQNIVIKNTENGTPILMKDVGSVQLGHAVRYGAMTRNGDGEVVGAIVMMLKGANSSKVIANVKERITQIEQSLPEGVAIRPFLDRTKLVNKAINTVTKNLVEGALIVIFILVLLLGNLRAGLIVASVIPLAMLFAICLMNVFGVSGNLMSLGAIDFGIIVDGSVIIVEATLHYLAQNKSGEVLTQKQMDKEVYASASKIRTSAAFGELIILIVYLPILALVGIEGKMFKPMAITVSFAILGAFLLSLTYVPMMSALFLNKRIKNSTNISDRIIEIVKKWYQPILHTALKHKIKVLVLSLVLFGVSIFTFTRMGAEFIPSLDEGDLAVQAIVPTGSSLSYSVDVSNQASKLLQTSFPDEIEQIVCRIGSSEIPTDPMPIEATDMIIILKDKTMWKAASSKNELTQKMQQLLEENMLGVSFGFQQPIQMRFNELMTGARQDVVLKIYGENLDKLVTYANDLSKIIQKIDGAEDVYVEKMTGLKQIVVDFNRSQLAYYGLNIEDVNTAINTAFAGQAAGMVYEGEKRFDLVVRLAENNRGSIDDIKKLYITTPKGIQIPLANIANISFKTSINQIQRDDAKRRITVGFNIRERDVASIVTQLQQLVSEKINFDPGYYITYGGTFKNLEEAKERLSIAVPMALLLIFFLLYITFNSVKQSLLIFTAIPMSAIGGIVALWLRNMPFSISAGIGFIALFGVAVLNGIVLIAEFNRLKKQGISDIYEIVKKGTSIRLRPVIMTAAVASLGFLPMALSTSEGAEVQKPLATVVIGGLVSATLLTLLILPVLYVLFEKARFKKLRISKTITVLIVCMVASKIQAQEMVKELSELEAINLAIEQSVNIKKSDLLVKRNEVAISEAIRLNPTNVQYQNVGVLPGVNEQEFSVSQNFGSVLTHIQRKNKAKATKELSQIQNALIRKETEKKVKQLYQQWNYLYGLWSLIEEQQKNSETINGIAKQLHEVGEIGGLENDLTKLQFLGVQSQKNTVFKQYSQVEIELKTLLQIPYAIKPVHRFPLKRSWLEKQDSISTMFSKSFDAKSKVAEKETDLAKSVYFPEITAGIIDRKTGVSSSYTGYSVGLTIPISFWSNRSKVSQRKIQEEEVAVENKAKALGIENNFKSLQQQIHYLNKELLNIDSTVAVAEKFIYKLQLAYKSGEIDAFQYTQSFSAYFQVMQNYLSLINNYNQTIIEYEFYKE